MAQYSIITVLRTSIMYDCQIYWVTHFWMSLRNSPNWRIDQLRCIAANRAFNCIQRTGHYITHLYLDCSSERFLNEWLWVRRGCHTKYLNCLPWTPLRKSYVLLVWGIFSPISFNEDVIYGSPLSVHHCIILGWDLQMGVFGGEDFARESLRWVRRERERGRTRKNCFDNNIWYSMRANMYLDSPAALHRDERFIYRW